jgi:peptidoglycan hydrolase-like protein with peptidoglycan-binding domain
LHLRKAIAVLAVSLACCASLSADTAAKKKPTQAKASAPVPARKKTAARRPPTRTWRAGQMAPTPDRYKEIQDALAKRGYLHGEATGAWNQDSADALRRFQQDQNLQPSGKLNSLSLIALGLGPKHGMTAEKPPASQP